MYDVNIALLTNEEIPNVAESQGSVRTTISMPSDLKVRMERVRETVNWSAVACRAFENKLAEIAARKEKKAMSDVVERLRASLRIEQGANYQDGWEAGCVWCKEQASAEELRRLQEFEQLIKDKGKRAWEQWFSEQREHIPWMRLVDLIHKHEFPQPEGTAIPFWKRVLGEEKHQKLRSGDFLRGFVEGAMELWSKVQKEL